jgi:DNA primase
MSSDNVLDEIRSRMDIVALISDSITLKRAGRNYKGLCPFHPEKTPSFTVSPEKQIFHCFGCGAGGDIFGFLMRQENLSFPEARDLLAKKAGVEVKSGGRREPGLREALKAMQKEAVGFYREHLGKSEAARGYLKDRGVSDASVESFSIGCSPKEWHRLYDRLKGMGQKDSWIMQSGLVASGRRGPYDVFRSRIIFPILDVQAEAIALGGRLMGGESEGQPKYLNSPDTPLFKKRETLYALSKAKDEIGKKGYSVLVEGYLDAIMCHQAGITNVVAPLGTALTPGHLRKLGRYSGKLLLVFDADRAGVAAARRSLSLILEHGLRAKVLILPEGEDPDSMIRKSGPDRLTALMREALSPVRFMLESSTGDRVEAAKEAIELIAGSGEPLLRDELIAELADRAGIRELSIREELRRFQKTGSFTAGADIARGGGAATLYNEETLLLSIALFRAGKVGDILEDIGLEDFRDPMVRRVFEKLRDAGGASAMELAESDEERALISRLSVAPGFEPEDMDLNIVDCVRKVKMRRLQEEVSRIDEDIKSAERAGDSELLRRLLSRRQELARGMG